MPDDDQIDPQADPATPGTPDPAAAPESQLPEWAQKELTRARNEAASYRTQLRDAQGKLQAAKSPEDIAALNTDFAKQIADKDREIASLRFSLPEDLARRVTGASFEEMLADAESLAKFAPATPAAPQPPAPRAPQPPARLAGGLTPAPGGNGGFDPESLAKEVFSTLRRF